MYVPVVHNCFEKLARRAAPDPKECIHTSQSMRGYFQPVSWDVSPDNTHTLDVADCCTLRAALGGIALQSRQSVVPTDQLSGQGLKQKNISKQLCKPMTHVLCRCVRGGSLLHAAASTGSLNAVKVRLFPLSLTLVHPVYALLVNSPVLTCGPLCCRSCWGRRSDQIFVTRVEPHHSTSRGTPPS